MMSNSGWRMVVRFTYSQPAISMSLNPMTPMSSGTRSPASRMALSAPIDNTSSPQK